MFKELRKILTWLAVCILLILFIKLDHLAPGTSGRRILGSSTGRSLAHFPIPRLDK